LVARKISITAFVEAVNSGVRPAAFTAAVIVPASLGSTEGDGDAASKGTPPNRFLFTQERSGEARVTVML
jgi:hypothetical protein